MGPNLLILHGKPNAVGFLPKVISEEGYRVTSTDDVDLIWEYIENTQPDLMLIDVGSDGFGAMNLYFEIKQKYADLSVIIYQVKDIECADRIKEFITYALKEKNN
jgi:DNA-binding response OmpR family regulator